MNATFSICDFGKLVAFGKVLSADGLQMKMAGGNAHVVLSPSKARPANHMCRAGGNSKPSRSRAFQRSGIEGGFLEFDVVVVGAGIIGLAIANRILTDTKLSVAIVDAAQPGAATGAGQGYIWMGHQQPGSWGWALASRSKHLWEQLVTGLRLSGTDPFTAIGWQNTGSMLVACSPEEAQGLQIRVEKLNAAGVDAEYLSASAIHMAEPALAVGDEGGAVCVFGDSQIDAALAVALLRQRNSAYSMPGRFKELFQDPVLQILWSPLDGRISVVQTSRHSIYCGEAVIIAAGAWSASLMSTLFEDSEIPYIPPVRPRKGHLLVLEGFPHLKLKHGLMEFEYMAKRSTVLGLHSSRPVDGESSCQPDLESASSSTSDMAFGVAMTATMDPLGRLLLGSSREFTGFDISPQDTVLDCILARASKFLPALADVSFRQALQMGGVRTGLRPYASDGRPLIGPVPGLPGLLLATGHEGSGLCMALGTAEMVVSMILGVDGPLDCSPYSPAGRLSCYKAFN